MFSILGAVLFGVIAIMTVLVTCGLPLGEFTMGGQHKILPKKFRVMAVISVAIQIFAMIIILQAGGFISLWLSFKVTKYICFFFAVYLFLNTRNFILNFIIYYIFKITYLKINCVRIYYSICLCYTLKYII